MVKTTWVFIFSKLSIIFHFQLKISVPVVHNLCRALNVSLQKRYVEVLTSSTLRCYLSWNSVFAEIIQIK